MTKGDSRLQRLLGGDTLASLRKRLRQRFERGPVDGKIERLRISNLSRHEHAALAGLIGRPGTLFKFYAGRCANGRRRAKPSGHRNVISRSTGFIDGPIIHAETARAELKAGWSNAISVATHLDLSSFLQTSFGGGLLKRLSNSDTEVAARFCSQADTVLKLLPAKGMTRAQLAAKCLGDAHALDPGQAVATLVLAVWRKKSVDPRPCEKTPTLEDDDVREVGDDWIRDIWAKAGIWSTNSHGRPTSSHNQRRSRAATLIRRAELLTSLRFLLRSDPLWSVRGRDIYVSENPICLLSADKLGVNCAPMVCTEGMPAAAQRALCNSS